MKLSTKFLKDYVDIDVDVKKISRRYDKCRK